MACKYCDQKGYLIEPSKRGDTRETIGFGENLDVTGVRPCPKCDDTKAYSKYVKEELFGLKHVEEKVIVIDFAKARKQ